MIRFLRKILGIEPYNPDDDELLGRIVDMKDWLKERRIGNPIENDRFPGRRHPELRG